MSPDDALRHGGAPSNSTIFVVSGPSGSGKETAIHYLMAKHGVERVVTLTTRKLRKGEVSGQQYEFVDNAEFVRRGINGDLLEFNRTYGSHAYASPSSLLSEDGAPAECVLEMDPQGYVELKERSNRRVAGIFLVPPSLQTLRERITARSAVADLDARLRVASGQFVYSSLYEYRILNDNLNDLHAMLDAIILTERMQSLAGVAVRTMLDEARRREYESLLGSADD
jgi:guanylate kinase